MQQQPTGSHRNHPYQRLDLLTHTSNSMQSLERAPPLRSSAEMTLNEYNRSENNSGDEMLRRVPVKLRASEAISSPPTTNYMLNAVHESDAYRLALKQEPETGY